MIYLIIKKYITLKNYLYNYRLRKRAIEKALSGEDMILTLEVGSGISPVVTITDRIVYTDISFSAIRYTEKNQQQGWYVVADAINLPFKRTSFFSCDCLRGFRAPAGRSQSFREMAAVVKPSGQLIITFPHRHFISLWMTGLFNISGDMNLMKCQRDCRRLA